MNAFLGLDSDEEENETKKEKEQEDETTDELDIDDFDIDSLDDMKKRDLVEFIESNEKVFDIKNPKGTKASELREELTDIIEGLKSSKEEGKVDKKGLGKCPHDHTFGEDCDEHPDDCDECGEWKDEI